MRVLALGAILLLAGCAAGQQAIDPGTLPVVATPTKTAQQACPKADVWTPQEIKDLGAALAPLPDDSLIIRMSLEWYRLRKDALACASVK